MTFLFLHFSSEIVPIAINKDTENLFSFKESIKASSINKVGFKLSIQLLSTGKNPEIILLISVE